MSVSRFQRPHFSLLTWNARGLEMKGPKGRKQKVQSMLKLGRKADTSCIQESHIDNAKAPGFRARMFALGFRCVIMRSYGTGKEHLDGDPQRKPRIHRGSVILFRMGRLRGLEAPYVTIIPHVAHGVYFDGSGEVQLLVLNIHLHSSSGTARREEVLRISAWLTIWKAGMRAGRCHGQCPDTSSTLILIAGDTNISLGPHERWCPNGAPDVSDSRAGPAANAFLTF